MICRKEIKIVCIILYNLMKNLFFCILILHYCIFGRIKLLEILLGFIINIFIFIFYLKYKISDCKKYIYEIKFNIFIVLTISLFCANLNMT